MADNFLDSACYVLGIKDNRRPSDLLIWLTMTGQLGRWPTAGGAELSAAVHGPGAVHPWPTDLNPLEVVIDPIDDRDPIEANSLLSRHVAVVIP